MTKRRIIKWLGGLSGLCVILFFAVAFILPRILDSQPVKEKIRAFLLAKTNENVAFEKIDLAWLPRPTVVVHGATLSVADKVSGKIESIEVYPSIMGSTLGALGHLAGGGGEPRGRGAAARAGRRSFQH